MDKARAEKVLAEVDDQVKTIEAEIETLTGSANKKARNAKAKEAAALKKGEDYVDAERVLAGKEPMQDRNKCAANKVEEKKPEVVVTGEVKGVVAIKAIGGDGPKKEKKEKKEAAGISAEERKELDKLKEDVIARKKELKAEGMTGGQMNKDAQIVTWVKRLNELKEKAGELEKKEDKKKAKVAKGGTEAIERLKQEIESYKDKLKTEFGYTKADINKDEDIVAMTKKLKEMKG
jgi:hypothetical protein